MLRTLKSHGSVLDSFTNIHLAAPAPCSHLLQFYADDDQLLDRLEEFVYFGLKGREACIIFATAAHLAELRTRLAAEISIRTREKRRASHRARRPRRSRSVHERRIA